MIANETDYVSEELIWTFLYRYQIGFEESMGTYKFVFNHVNGLYRKCHRIMSYCGGSYMQILLIGSKTKSHNSS